MKKTRIFLICSIFVLVSGTAIFSYSKLKADSQTSLKSQTTETVKENPTIQQALKEFDSVAAFDQHFQVNVKTNRPDLEITKDSYIISVSVVTGDKDGGWATAKKTSSNVLSEITNMNGEVLYTIKGDDPRGTTIGEIEAAFATEDT